MASWSAIVAVVEENKDAIENDGSRNWMELARCTTSTSATSRKAREIALIPAPFGSFLAALILLWILWWQSPHFPCSSSVDLFTRRIQLVLY